MAHGDYAWADPAAAVAAFAVAGAALRLPGPEVARRMLAAASEHIGDLVSAVAAQHHLRSPVLVAVGGGAGTLGRAVATALGLDIVVPEGAEVISSIGDALSLVRAERERTFGTTTISAADVDALVQEVEAEVLSAGAAPASVDVQVIRVPERGAVRAVATGALALASGVTAGRPPITAVEAATIGADRGVAEAPTPIGPYWLLAGSGRVVVLDRFGDVVLEVRGEAVVGPALTGMFDADGLGALLERHVRHMGPVTVSPTAWLLRGSQLAELGEPDAAALAEVVRGNAHHADLALVVGRS